jgi:hypothetical protein
MLRRTALLSRNDRPGSWRGLSQWYLKPHREPRGEVRDGGSPSCDLRGEDRESLRSGKRWPSGEHLEQDAGQGIDVRATVYRVSRRLFRAHVVRGADNESGLCETLCLGLCCRCHRPGDSEIGDDGDAVGEQDVLRLDVAVDDSVPVSVRQRAGDLTRQSQRFVEGKGLLPVEMCPQ